MSQIVSRVVSRVIMSTDISAESSNKQVDHRLLQELREYKGSSSHQ